MTLIQDDRIPSSDRVSLECQLFVEIERGLQTVEEMCLSFNDVMEKKDTQQIDRDYEVGYCRRVTVIGRTPSG